MRSASLTPRDKNNLMRRNSFIKDEMNLLPRFKDLSWKTYQDDSLERKIVERWIENLCNAAIDIAKIMLSSESKKIPDTYKETLHMLALLDGFEEKIALELANFSKLRNIISHEYLDIRFKQIREFVDSAERLYPYLVDFVDRFTKK